MNKSRQSFMETISNSFFFLIFQSNNKMGIWSYSLGVACFDQNDKFIDPKKVLINLTGINENWLRNITNHGFFDNGEKLETNFEEAMHSTCETMKLYGYFVLQEIISWESLFKIISIQNPLIKRFEAHFFCSDEDMPYSVVHRNNETNWYKFPQGNALYTNFKKNPNGDDSPFEFDKTNYQKCLKNVKYYGFLKRLGVVFALKTNLLYF